MNIKINVVGILYLLSGCSILFAIKYKINYNSEYPLLIWHVDE